MNETKERKIWYEFCMIDDLLVQCMRQTGYKRRVYLGT